MEENNLILGRIPGGCGGIHKTYEESFIRIVDEKIIDCLRNGLNFKFYIDSSSNNELIVLADLENGLPSIFDEGDVPSQDKWWYETGGGGWGNNEVQTYVAGSQNGTKLATISNGTLKIRARKIDGKVYSIRMNTKKYWTYGWFEARLKVSDLSGAWPAFWMMPQNYTAWPKDGEIDIMEYAIATQGENKVSSSIHCDAFNWPAGTQKTHVQTITNAASEFHVYALEWTEDQMNFYVDGQVHLTFENDGQGYSHWPFNQDFYLKLNMAWGGNMGGTTNDSGLPATYEVDYVRVFQKQ